MAAIGPTDTGDPTYHSELAEQCFNLSASGCYRDSDKPDYVSDTGAAALTAVHFAGVSDMKTAMLCKK